MLIYYCSYLGKVDVKEEISGLALEDPDAPERKFKGPGKPGRRHLAEAAVSHLTLWITFEFGGLLEGLYLISSVSCSSLLAVPCQKRALFCAGSAGPSLTPDVSSKNCQKLPKDKATINCV